MVRTISTADIAPIWRCGAGLGVEATDRIVHVALKDARLTRAERRGVEKLWVNLNAAMQIVVNETRKPIDIRSYADAFAEQKRIIALVASAGAVEDESAGLQGDAQPGASS